MLGFATSRAVREDAVVQIKRSLEGYTARKINIITYEQTRMDNSVLWERPYESVEVLVRGLFFVIWSNRALLEHEEEQLDQVEEEAQYDDQQFYVV